MNKQIKEKKKERKPKDGRLAEKLKIGRGKQNKGT